jgi:hypothetical protein
VPNYEIDVRSRHVENKHARRGGVLPSQAVASELAARAAAPSTTPTRTSDDTSLQQTLNPRDQRRHRRGPLPASPLRPVV